MKPQITLLPTRPAQARLRPVVNPPVFPVGGNILAWLRAGYYRGNKPLGGLWTSTATPEDDYPCDWARGLATNGATRAAMPPEVVAALRVFPLYPRAGARVLRIDTLEQAREFSRAYGVATLPLPPLMLMGGGALLTTEVTDWERATRDHGAIQLSGDGADAVARAQLCGIQTAFGTWHCESTLWSAWDFSEVGEGWANN